MSVAPVLDVSKSYEEVTKRALPEEVCELVVRMHMEEEVTSVVNSGELIPVFEGEAEGEDELEILESWPIGE